MLAVVSAERNSELLVLPVGNRPFAHGVGHVERIVSVDIRVSLGRIGIRRVEENGRQPLTGRWRWSANSRPVARANTHTLQALSKGSHPFVDTFIPAQRLLPGAFKVDSRAVDALPGASKVDSLAVDAPPGASKVDSLALDALPVASKVD